MKPHRLGASTFSFMWEEPALHSMRKVLAGGLNDFDVIVSPGHLWPEELSEVERRELSQALRTDGIRLGSLNLPALDLNLASCVHEVRRYSVDVFGATLGLSAELGGHAVVMVPGRVSSLLPPHDSDVLGWLSDSVSQILPIAERTDQTIFMESHPLTPIPDVDRIVAFVDRLDHPRLKVAYDVANAEFIGEHQPTALRRLATRLGQVHLSDGTRTWWRHDKAGLGTVNFEAILSTLSEIAFRGISVVEIISPNPLDDIQATKAYLENLTRSS